MKPWSAAAILCRRKYTSKTRVDIFFKGGKWCRKSLWTVRVFNDPKGTVRRKQQQGNSNKGISGTYLGAVGLTLY